MNCCDIVCFPFEVGRLEDCEVEYRDQSSVYEGSDEEICRYAECVSNEASNDLTEKDIMSVAGTITGYCCGSPNLRPRVQHQIPHSNRPTSLVNEEYIADGRGKDCK